MIKQPLDMQSERNRQFVDTVLHQLGDTFGDVADALRQCLPPDGYTRIFEWIIDHLNIGFLPCTDFADVCDIVPHAHLVHAARSTSSGLLLPYRLLRFEHTTLDQPHLQDVAVVNYPSPDVPYTRTRNISISPGRSIRSQHHARVPPDEGDPYHALPAPESAALYRRYEALAERTPGVTFTGRLCTHRYYNMD